MTWFERPRDPQEQHGFDMTGALVKRRRASLGWSQRYLEAQSGIDQTVISRIENGKQYGIRWSRFALLIDALGGLDIAMAPWAVPRVSNPLAQSAPSVRPIDRVDLEAGLDDPEDED